MRLRNIAIATAFALNSIAGYASAASPFSQIYFFGDSLSDVGAFANVPYNTSITLGPNARWITGYAPSWTDYVANYYGLTSVANNPNNAANTSASGNNYAQGGAQAQTGVFFTNPHNAPTSAGLPINDLAAQVQSYLSNNTVNPTAAYSVWIGGNDISAALIAERMAPGSAATVLQNAANVAVGIGQQLQQQGAHVVIMPNIPDVSRAPALLYQTINLALAAALQQQGINPATSAGRTLLAQYQSQLFPLISSIVSSPQILTEAGRISAYQQAISLVAATLAQGNTAQQTVLQQQMSTALGQLQSGLAQATTGFNALVDSGIAATHGIVRPNIYQLFQEILANPTAYGFTNIAGSDCLDAIVCPRAINTAQSYLFSDGLHPSPQAHALLGRYITSILAAPSFASALPETALGNARQLGSALSSRYEANRATSRETGNVNAYVSGTWRPDNYSYAGVSGKVKGELYTVGVDIQATPTLTLGVAAGYSGGSTNVNNLGFIDNGSTLVAATGSWNDQGIWIDADVNVGDIRMTSNRQAIGRTLTAQVAGNQWGARTAGGYEFNAGPVKTGPTLGLDYARVKIKTVTEAGNDSTTMLFGPQTVSSLLGRVGWQVKGLFANTTPYAQVNWVHEFKQQNRYVTAGLTTMPGDFTLNLGQGDSSWAEWKLGISANLTKVVTAFGQVSTTSGRSSGNQTAATVGIAAKF